MKICEFCKSEVNDVLRRKIIKHEVLSVCDCCYEIVTEQSIKQTGIDKLKQTCKATNDFIQLVDDNYDEIKKQNPFVKNES